MSAHDDIEPLGRDDTAPTLEELEALDRAEQRPPDHAADAQYVADMTPALELDIRDPAQARQWVAAHQRAERRRRVTVRRQRGGTP